MDWSWRQGLAVLPGASIRAPQAKSWPPISIRMQNEAEAAGETAREQWEAGGWSYQRGGGLAMRPEHGQNMKGNGDANSRGHHV